MHILIYFLYRPGLAGFNWRATSDKQPAAFNQKCTRSSPKIRKNPKFFSTLPTPYFIIIYTFSVFSFFSAADIFFASNTQVRPIIERHYVSRLNEIKKMLSETKTCPPFVWRIYPPLRLAGLPRRSSDVVYRNEAGSIKNNKLCKTNPISEKQKMNLSSYTTKTYGNKSRLLTMAKQTQSNPKRGAPAIQRNSSNLAHHSAIFRGLFENHSRTIRDNSRTIREPLALWLTPSLNLAHLAKNRPKLSLFLTKKAWRPKWPPRIKTSEVTQSKDVTDCWD